MAKARLVYLLRCTFGASLLHALWRLLSDWLKARRMRRILHKTPPIKAPCSSIMGHLKPLFQHVKRRNDWFHEVTTGLPVATMLGPVWSPDSVLLVVRDPESVKHFLKDAFHTYTKVSPLRDPISLYLEDFLGMGIFTSKHGLGASDGGRSWHFQRKVSSTIFSRHSNAEGDRKNFNTHMQSVFVAKAHRLKSVLRSGEVTDMQQQFFNYTMDSIMSIFFGEESDLIGGQSNDFAQAFDVAHRSFLEYALHSMQPFAVLKYLPWPLGGLQGLAIQTHQWCSSRYRAFRAAWATLDRYSRAMVHKCREDKALANRSDLLALFVQAEEREKLSTEWLRDMLLNLIIAGRDTTACALSWMFYILSTDPELQERVMAEVVETHPTGVEPTWDSVAPNRVPVLNGLLYETLRLYPPVPFDWKECHQEDVFPDGTKVPQHAKVAWLPYAMGRDPEKYPDPEKVKPERWIPFTQPSPHEFPVFQAGPRICLGMEMALFEAKLVAVVLLRDWSFTLKPGEAEHITYSQMLTMSVCNSKEQDSHHLWLIPQSRC